MLYKVDHQYSYMWDLILNLYSCIEEMTLLLPTLYQFLTKQQLFKYLFQTCSFFVFTLILNVASKYKSFFPSLKYHRIFVSKTHSSFLIICKINYWLIAFWTNSQENTCARVNFIKKETLAQVFSCEFWQISTSTFFTEHPW